MQADLFVEYNGIQVNANLFMDYVKEIWKGEGNKIKDMKTVNIYYKPEENICYYVINDDLKGSFQP